MLLKTEDLCKRYDGSKVLAVDNANIEIKEGSTVGLFGDSGSGKSTLGMMTAGLVKPSSGKIFFEGSEISMRYKGDVRRWIQILFQHPETTFNPSLVLLRSMTEPYKRYGLPYTYEGMLEYIKGFGLYEEHLYRTPSQLSGGELQRAALARVLLLEPKLIVLDEPTSMLDVITQVQIINILKKYQRQHGTAYLFISHNRALCENVCDRIYSVGDGHFTLEE